jgi:hypothetical protein
MAKQQLFQALKLNPDSTLQSLIYLNLGRVYEKENMTDSAICFAKLSLRFVKNNNYTLANIYNILLNIEKERNNYKDAYKYHKYYTNCIMQINNEMYKYNMPETEARYKLNEVRNRLLSYKLYGGIATVFLCLAAGIIASIYIKRNHRIKRELKKIQSGMNEMEKSAEIKLTNLIKELSAMKDILKKTQSEKEELEESTAVILEKLNKKLNETGKRSAKTQIKLKERDVYLKILIEVYDVIESATGTDFKNFTNYFKSRVVNKYHKWDDIYKVEKPVFDKVKNLFPQLSDTEYKIACLDYLGYSNCMISIILDKRSITQTKTKIRAKINVEPEGNIGKFITKKIELYDDINPETGKIEDT